MTQRIGATPTVTASHLFKQMCRRFEGANPTLGEVAQFAGPQASALLLLLLTLPEALPLPVAGMSTILAIPLIFVSVRMIRYGAEIQLPVWLCQRTIPVRLFQDAAARLVTLLRHLERVSRPRWHGMVDATRSIGAACLVLAFVIALPIPFGNLLPALCIVGIAVGMLQRDGIIVAVSLAAGGFVVAGLSTALVLAGGAALSAVDNLGT